MKSKSITLKMFMCPTALLFFCLACAQERPDETSYFQDVTISHLPIDPKTHALDVALADFNGDGHLDLVLALESEPNRLYLNDGNGKFSWLKDVFVNKSHDTEHVRVGDFDKDGFLDLIFVAEDDQNHEYYLGNGDGTFRDVSDRLLAKSEANGLDIGDINGDGLLDVVVGNSGERPGNFLWLNDSSRPGYFVDASAEALPKHVDQTQSIKLVDLDGDGHLDMVIANEVPPNRIYFNDGKGYFQERDGALEEKVELHTREVVAFDANGDSLLDLFFANLTSNGGKRERDSRGRLFINQGNGKFVDETESRIPEYDFSTYAANVIDYDRDGDLDILLSAIRIPPFEADRVRMLQNDGKGNFTFVTDVVVPAITIERSWGIAVGDVNNDGIQDVVIGAWGGQVRMLLGK